MSAAGALLAAAALTGCTAHPASRPSDDPKPPGPTAPPTGGAPASAPPVPPTSAPKEPGTPPATDARDGRNYAACADGGCQVLVDAPAAIRVGHRVLHASVSGSTVLLTESANGSRTAMSLTGPGGHGRILTNGTTIDVTVRRAARGTAVLDISTP